MLKSIQIGVLCIAQLREPIAEFVLLHRRRSRRPDSGILGARKLLIQVDSGLLCHLLHQAVHLGGGGRVKTK